jgi:Lipoxygenase
MYGSSSSLTDAIKALVTKLEKEPETVLQSLSDATFLKSGDPVSTIDTSPLTSLSLDKPEEFTLSWTTYQDIYKKSSQLVPAFASSLPDADAATELFWPMIATFSMAYNLLVLQKVGPSQLPTIQSAFQKVWASEGLDALYTDGRLYVIDMGIFKSVQPQSVEGRERFTPSTITLLKQDRQSKSLTPIAILVSDPAGDSHAQIYLRTDSAWLYALQAAKTAITVYGIWLGHVYHWHIVTAAMQMTMYNTIPGEHRISQLLSPQSRYLIEFDEVLLLLWSYIAPPTSISTPFQFLVLADRFATDRSFFDDDPTTTLERLGLQQADFSLKKPWDVYPIVQYLLDLWTSTEEYIEKVVEARYNDDAAVAHDEALQAWIAASSDRNEGNIRGLPTMDSKSALKRVLTSLIYRVTAHGVSRLNISANPVLTFVANFPPCLQDTSITKPDSEIDTKRLLAFLPVTGTIGQMATFYFTFVFSSPYEPFIPLDGPEKDLFFHGGDGVDQCNQALVNYRYRMIDFIKSYIAAQQEVLAQLEKQGNIQAGELQGDSSQIHQWPLNIET